MAISKELVRRLKLHDEHAFDEIYHQTKHVVYGVIIHIVKNQHTAEDLMQETYLSMLESIHAYRDQGKFQSWLLQIARNKAIDYYRRKQKEIIVTQEDIELFVSEKQITSEQQLLVEELLSRLQDVEKEIYLLKVVYNIKHREIAKLLSLPIGTVLWHYQKAKKKIKQ